MRALFIGEEPNMSLKKKEKLYNGIDGIEDFGM